jgi:RNA polymerase sigma factor (sigma-70 family)
VLNTQADGPDRELWPENILSSADTLGRIEAVCRRRFPDESEADEAFLYVLEGLKADDFRRLRSYQGRAKLTTFIHTLTNSLASDFKRRRYGRKRIPKLVSRLGPWAEEVYRLVCWQGYQLREAFEIVRLEGLFQGGFGRFIKETEAVKEAPCRENPRFFSVDNEKGPIRDIPDQGLNPLEALLSALEEESRLKAAGIIREALSGLEEADRILIRLVYESGHSAASAGRVAGLSPNAARKRLKSILTGLKEVLLSQGITK